VPTKRRHTLPVPASSVAAGGDGPLPLRLVAEAAAPPVSIPPWRPCDDGRAPDSQSYQVSLPSQGRPDVEGDLIL